MNDPTDLVDPVEVARIRRALTRRRLEFQRAELIDDLIRLEGQQKAKGEELRKCVAELASLNPFPQSRQVRGTAGDPEDGAESTGQNPRPAARASSCPGAGRGAEGPTTVDGTEGSGPSCPRRCPGP
jgi:hypothetical protein